jgi:hypothetical protein
MLGEHLCPLLQQDPDGGNLWRSHGLWLVSELLQVVGLHQIVDGVLQRFEQDALPWRQLAQSKPAPLPPAPVVEWRWQRSRGLDHRDLEPIGDSVANARREQ